MLVARFDCGSVAFGIGGSSSLLSLRFPQNLLGIRWRRSKSHGDNRWQQGVTALLP